MSKNSGVNYIKHLERISEVFYEDKRLSPWHISLYYGLFHMWNKSKFQNPISICRTELMMVSKIGSKNTYTKCLRQLDEWGYLNYFPSHNPMKGSLVNLYTFEPTTGKSTSPTSGKTSEPTPVTVVVPSINSLNKKKHIKPNKLSGGNSTISPSNKSRFVPPTIDMVIDFFKQSPFTEHAEVEAEKYFNYYSSNGWLVGGKAKMKDWKAAARNWKLNATKFQATNNTQKSSNHLHIEQNKDYNIPL